MNRIILAAAASIATFHGNPAAGAAYTLQRAAISIPAPSATETAPGSRVEDQVLPRDRRSTTTWQIAVVKPGSPDAKRRSSARPYSAIIARHARQNGVPLPLARAVISVESNYRPNARGRAGEVGLMQIKPATARLMGYRGSRNGLFDPETNIRFGMKYLGKAYRLGGGDLCGTVLRYNAGHGAKRMNRISAAYCRKVKRMLRTR